MKRGEIIDFQAAWQKHCAPLIESGQAVIYGSPEHLEREAQRRADQKEKPAANDADPKRPAVEGIARRDPWSDLPFGQFTGGKG